MRLTIDEIRARLSKIKQMGYVKTMRTGNTGVGFTLESLLEIEENNISSPDLGDIELKAVREGHKGMITLLTFNKGAWKMDPLAAIKKYGSKDGDGRLGMYYTMSMTPNSAGVFLYVDDDVVAVRSIDGSVVAEWQLAEIEKHLAAKVENVLLVKAKVELRDGAEYFLFDRARLLSGGTTKKILKNQFENGQILIDLRLHDAGTMARNHGTGFRVYESNLDDLYEKIEEIEF